MVRRQGTYWLLTVPHAHFVPYVPKGVAWIKGQLELGEGGFLHWQLIVGFQNKCSLNQVRQVFGPFHAELTRSNAAEDYVWKEETAVVGTKFELGTKPFNRASSQDWDVIWDAAAKGNFAEIPADVRIRSYFALRAIRAEFLLPVGIIRTCVVFWGKSGTGKSRRAWDEAGNEGYPKDPRTKFWCGYQHQEHVVVDEFRGGIDISHILRWLDRYPVRVEIKGSSVPLFATKFWFTSNVHPRQWWPELDIETLEAFYRRVEIVEF